MIDHPSILVVEKFWTKIYLISGPITIQKDHLDLFLTFENAFNFCSQILRNPVNFSNTEIWGLVIRYIYDILGQGAIQ